MAEVDVSGEVLTVWVADEPNERRQGLREVEALPPGIEGMLFVYGAPVRVSYGMLNTPMPLDIWFFDANGALIGSAEMTPCPEPPCPAYRSPGRVGWVLETPQGGYQFAASATISTVETG